MTERLTSQPADIARAADLLRAGEVVAFPTETVYGLGADATNDEAVARIYAAKGRPSHNPLIVHVLDAGEARRYASSWPPEADLLARAFWPGPLTLVVPAASELSALALAGGSTVGLRAPAHPVAQLLLRACGLPLAAPSANRSGELSPVEARHVLDHLDGRISAVVDGGACAVGIESTVIDLSSSVPVILRPGMVGRAEIERVLERTVESRTARQATDDLSAMKSPGMLDRHYAPSIPLHLKQRAEILCAPRGVARLFLDEDMLGSTPESVARNLYRCLWEAQSTGAREIWLETPPRLPEWDPIHDRLGRAVEKK